MIVAGRFMGMIYKSQALTFMAQAQKSVLPKNV
jgi:hypothetical protein